ncbi:hypothetical protein [Allofournierella sp.]|uniref:hypothetical protein n=1 Tax=Allofournierella sp. TaxID=1940256 RepID=UPI003AB279EF
MAWEDFYALYQAAGKADAASHTVTLTGSLTLRGGSYELGPTEVPVTVETPGRFSIEVLADARLTVNNPGLTVFAAQNENGGAFIVSGGYLRLIECAVEAEDCPAIGLFSTGEHLVTGGGARRVRMEVSYGGAAMQGGVRAGILSGPAQGEPVRLNDLEMTVTGGAAAIYAADSVELRNCRIEARGENAAAVQFGLNDSGLCTLTADTGTVLVPWQESAPPEAEQAPYAVTGAVAGRGTERERKGWAVAGMARGELAMPERGVVFYESEDGQEGYIENVPLVWDTAALADPLAPGKYALAGAPVCGGLAQEGRPVENPAGVTAEFALTVWAAGAPQGLRVESNPRDGGRLATYQGLPPVAAAGATAVYAEYSADGQTWRRARVNTTWNAEEPVYSENLLEDFCFDWGADWGAPEEGDPGSEFTVFIPETAFYTRLVVEGGPFAGQSNTVEHGVLAPAPTEQPDGGGDRGGGGQGEHDRPGKAEPTPAPSAAPPRPGADAGKNGPVGERAEPTGAPPQPEPTPPQGGEESAARPQAAASAEPAAAGPAAGPPPAGGQGPLIAAAATGFLMLCGGGVWFGVSRRKK